MRAWFAQQAIKGFRKAGALELWCLDAPQLSLDFCNLPFLGARKCQRWHRSCDLSTARGFEALRAEPNGFRVHLLDRSDTVSLQHMERNALAGARTPRAVARARSNRREHSRAKGLRACRARARACPRARARGRTNQKPSDNCWPMTLWPSG